MLGLIALAGTPDGLGACPPMAVTAQFDCGTGPGIIADCLRDPSSHPNCCSWTNSGTVAAAARRCGVAFDVTPPGHKIPTWGWLLGGAVVIGAGILLLKKRGRR